MVKKIVETNEFNEFKKDGLCLVDCYADWCGPCKMLAPVIEEISEELTEWKFAKINVDELGEVAQLYRIMSIPNLLIFKNGELIQQLVGFRSKSELIKILNALK